MCICIYLFIFIYIYLYVYVYMCMIVHVYAYVYVYVHVYVYVYVKIMRFNQQKIGCDQETLGFQSANIGYSRYSCLQHEDWQVGKHNSNNKDLW
jgi:hypothetical protein